MARLTKQKVREIINQRPEGTSPEEVIQGLQDRGHTLEGFAVSKIETRATQVAQAPQREEERGTLQKIAGFFGSEKLGTRIGSELVKFTKEGRDLKKLLNEGNISQEEYNNIVTGGVSGREALASLGVTAATIALPFAGKAIGGLKVPGLVGKTFKGTVGRGAVLGAGLATGEALTEKEVTAGDVARKAALGATVGGAIPIVGALGKYIASRTPKLLGIISGESDDAIRAALANPEIADKAIAAGDDALRKAVQEGGTQSIKMRTNFIKGHAQAFSKLAGKNSDKLVNKQVLRKNFTDILKDNRVKVTAKGLDFRTSPIKANPGEMSKVKDAFEALQEWKDFSLSGVNEYKQLVGKLTRFATEAGVPSKSPTLGRIFGSLDKTIKTELPKGASTQYAKLNKRFTNNIDMLDDMVDAFNKGDPFTRLAGVMGKNKDSLRQVLGYYDQQTGAGVGATIAGRELAMEKAAAFGIINPRSWIDFFLSPQLQASGVTRIGKIQRGAKEVVQRGLRVGTRELGTPAQAIREAGRTGVQTGIRNIIGEL